MLEQHGSVYLKVSASNATHIYVYIPGTKKYSVHKMNQKHQIQFNQINPNANFRLLYKAKLAY
jgi:hypothetical protein